MTGDSKQAKVESAGIPEVADGTPFQNRALTCAKSFFRSL
jgi:hypothetical protein